MKSANAYGVYDMSGSVAEWCWDWYSNSTPAGGQDPTGAASGENRVYRGSLVPLKYGIKKNQIVV